MACAELVGQEVDGELSTASKTVDDIALRDYSLPNGCCWRFGKPDYSKVNRLYAEKRAIVHKPDSLDAVVQNLVLNFLVESHNVEDVSKWKTTSEKYQIAVCGGTPANAHFLAQVGLWNVIWGNGTGNRLQAASDTNANIRSAFSTGLAFEILETYSGPPSVSFKFRFFGIHDGLFTDESGKQHLGAGRQLDLIGMCIAKVTAELKFETMDFYLNAYGDMLRWLKTNARPSTAGGA